MGDNVFLQESNAAPPICKEAKPPIDHYIDSGWQDKGGGEDHQIWYNVAEHLCPAQAHEMAWAK